MSLAKIPHAGIYLVWYENIYTYYIMLSVCIFMYVLHLCFNLKSIACRHIVCALLCRKTTSVFEL